MLSAGDETDRQAVATGTSGATSLVAASAPSANDETRTSLSNSSGGFGDFAVGHMLSEQLEDPEGHVDNAHQEDDERTIRKGKKALHSGRALEERSMYVREGCPIIPQCQETERG